LDYTYKHRRQLRIDGRVGLFENVDHVHDQIGELAPLIEKEQDADDHKGPAEGGRDDPLDSWAPAVVPAVFDLQSFLFAFLKNFVEFFRDVEMAAPIKLKGWAEIELKIKRSKRITVLPKLYNI